jgi:uncharacterized membrane protein
MFTYVLTVSIGFIAGLRTMTAPMAVSWAAYLGWLRLDGSPLAWMGHPLTPWLLTAFAIGEYVVDKLPSTPSRKLPLPFVARIISGSFCGAALGIAIDSPAIGAVCGALGAVIGTLLGSAARHALAQRFGKDLPAALIEDAVAIVGALMIVSAFQS